MIGSPLDAVAWNSRWRFRSVAEKVTLCGGLLGCAVALPAWPAAVLVLIATFGAARAAGVPARHLLRMLRIPAVFILVAGTSTALTLDPSGPLITMTHDGVVRAAETVARAIAATAATLLLASTTPMSDLTDSMRRVGVPAACVDVITAMYRMIFLLLESVVVVRKSQVSRLGYSSLTRSVRSAGLLTAAALTRAWQRAHALERGLAGRNLGMPLARPGKPAVSTRFVACAAAANAGIVLISVATLIVTG